MSYHHLDPSTIEPDADHPCRRRSITDATDLSNLAFAIYELDPGEPLSTDYHFHEYREEVFYVLTGELHIETPDEEFVVAPDEVFVVEPNSPIRPYNPSSAEAPIKVIGSGAPLYDIGRPYDEG